MENLNNKNKKYWDETLKRNAKENIFNREEVLVLDKDFIEFKNRKLEGREVKIKREIEGLFFQLIIVSVDEMDKLEQNEMTKISPIKSTCYD